MALQDVLTTDKIVEEYGRYYENAGQNRKRLVRALMNPSVTLDKNATRIPTEETIYKEANLKTESVVQPYKHEFTPMGGMDFIPNPIYLRQLKTDILIVPNKIESSWLGFLAKNNCSIKEWPIIRYIMEEYVKKQIEDDREHKIVYNGVYNPDAAEVKPENCIDGLHELMKKGAQSDYPINVIEGIGELSADTVLDQVENFNAKIPSRYFYEKLTLFMAPEMALEYLRNKRDKGYYQIKGDEEIGYRIDFTNHTIFGSPAMAGTKHLWASMENNILWLTKRYQPINNMQIQVFDRTVKLLLDWWEGFGFACNQMVWATEQTVGRETTPDEGGDDTPETIVVTPAVETEAATDVTAAGATLNGTVANAPEDSTVKFAYGTDAANLDGEAEAVAGEEGAYSAAVTGLTAETKYYFQIQLTAGGNTLLGQMASLTTLAS